MSKDATVEDNVALYNNRNYTQTFVSQHNASGPYWLDNVLGTISQPCVEHHVAPFSVTAAPQVSSAAVASSGLEPVMPLPANSRRLG